VDFFKAQRQARRSTWVLLLLYATSIVALIAGLFFLLKIVVVTQQLEKTVSNGQLLVYTAIGTLFVVGTASLYRVTQLRSGGGRAVCELVGGQPVPFATDTQEMRRLRNIVEEMAVASGTPVPSLYVMNESGINAFAAGYSPADASVCVTTGCLERLNRDELQGVVAHEYSHVLNGDMRLNIRLIGVLWGILCISIAGRQLLRVRGRRAGGVWAFGLGLFVLGALGAFFARLIQAAVSRQREFLADASAVQFTRNPAGISGALKKIAGYVTHGRLTHSAHVHATSHMFFVNALAKSWTRMFATHPPLEDRIKAIDPLFKLYKVAPAGAGGAAPEAAAGFAGGPSRVATIGADAAIEAIGQVNSEHVAHAREIISGLPDEVAGAVHEPFSARAVVCAMLLSDDSAVRRQQFQELSTELDPQTVQETLQLSGLVKQIDHGQRLPLLGLAMPALRQMSRLQAESFRKAVHALIRADKRITIFEFALERMLARQLDSMFFGKQATPVRFRARNDVIEDCAVVMAFLAYSGHDTAAAAEKAYADGMERMRPCRAVALMPQAECTRSRLEQALDRLAAASPEIKRQTLTALAHAAASDGELAAEEADLLRAVADTLECPMPAIPFERGRTVHPLP